jgi:hypothetical protein
MRSFGWAHTFIPQPWPDVRRKYVDLAEQVPEFVVLVSIVDSVIQSGSDQALAATTSMHDLLVTDVPIQEPPLEVITVSAPVGSLRAPSARGRVRIEHLAHTGRNDCIERPPAEAVPLFWRFVQEKFGISAAGPI